MGYDISGVILAGGANSRFGGIIKSNIVIDGKTIINRITDTICNDFSEIIIVTNSPDEFKEYSHFKIISDQFQKVGPLGGIHAALKASSCEALFVFAGDMPLLDNGMIISQIEFYLNHKCEILIPSVNKYIEPLHAIYKRSLLKKLDEYLSTNSEYSVREFIKRADVKYQFLKDTEETKFAFTNVNTPFDIIAVEEILRNS